MTKPPVSRLVLSALFAGLLLLPYLALVFQIDAWRLPLGEAGPVFLFTFAQAFASSAASLALGAVGAFGLVWWGVKRGPIAARAAEIVVLLPNAAPVLVLLLATLKFFPWARGFIGIVFVHALLNSGLVAVSLLRLFQAKIGGMAELAWVEGASRGKFLFRGVLPFLAGDLGTLFLFVFAVCFSSFAIPLVLGGSSATTIETLIYQKIRIDGDWGQAVSLGLLQTLAIFALSWCLRAKPAPSLANKTTRVPLLAWKWGLPAGLLAPTLLIVGLLVGLSDGLRQLLALPELREELPGLIAGSFGVAIGTGCSCAVVLAWIAYINPTGAFRKTLLGYAAPSAVLSGFAVLFFWRATGLASYIKIVLGLTLTAVPSFYRLQWDAVLRGLEGQRTVARVLGAGEGLLFKQIIWPQLARTAFWISGLASVWAWGDFSLSSVVAERPLSLAMVTQGLLESYRLPAATALLWLVLFGAGVTFLIFAGAGRVLDQES